MCASGQIMHWQQLSFRLDVRSLGSSPRDGKLVDWPLLNQYMGSVLFFAVEK
jgi:hypothetical protein